MTDGGAGDDLCPARACRLALEELGLLQETPKQPERSDARRLLAGTAVLWPGTLAGEPAEKDGAATSALREEPVPPLSSRFCLGPRPPLAPAPGNSDDLELVLRRFLGEVPEADVTAVRRVENSSQRSLYAAVKAGMTANAALVAMASACGSLLAPNEALLWHGTLVENARNIAVHGFNRAYCGRHGTKLGLGTYFAGRAGYAVRFCDAGCRPAATALQNAGAATRRGLLATAATAPPPSRPPHAGSAAGRERAEGGGRRRMMFLARVLVGEWTVGSPDLVEPPCKEDGLSLARFDSTTDSLDRPTMFCVFRDFQAVPEYLVEFRLPW